MYEKGSLAYCLMTDNIEPNVCRDIELKCLILGSFIAACILATIFEKHQEQCRTPKPAIEMDPVAVYNNYSLDSKVRHLLNVSDYDAIRNLPDIDSYVKTTRLAYFFNHSDKNLSDADTRKFAIWWIRHPNFKIHKYESFSNRLKTLVYEHAKEDVLIRSNINYDDGYELILVAIKRRFHRLLKRCLWVQYTVYQKPICYYVNSQIYKLLADNRYFDPKILTVYVNALNNINVPFDWNKLTLSQMYKLNEYDMARKSLDNDSDEEISDLEPVKDDEDEY